MHWHKWPAVWCLEFYWSEELRSCRAAGLGGRLCVWWCREPCSGAVAVQRGASGSSRPAAARTVPARAVLWELSSTAAWRRVCKQWLQGMAVETPVEAWPCSSAGRFHRCGCSCGVQVVLLMCAWCLVVCGCLIGASICGGCHSVSLDASIQQWMHRHRRAGCWTAQPGTAGSSASLAPPSLLSLLVLGGTAQWLWHHHQEAVLLLLLL
jgi:hypothetical protein